MGRHNALRQESHDGLGVVVVLVLGGLAGLRLDKALGIEANGGLVVNDHVEESLQESVYAQQNLSRDRVKMKTDEESGARRARELRGGYLERTARLSSSFFASVLRVDW